MRTTYRQIAAKFNTEDGLPMDPTLTNQYYEEACNDFEQDDDQSPTRERREREFHDQVCRSFNGTETSSKASRSQLTTINSMSRTIDPHHRPNPGRQSRYVASSRTIGSGRKHKGSSKSATDDGRWRISVQNRSWSTAIRIQVVLRSEIVPRKMPSVLWLRTRKSLRYAGLEHFCRLRRKTSSSLVAKPSKRWVSRLSTKCMTIWWSSALLNERTWRWMIRESLMACAHLLTTSMVVFLLINLSFSNCSPTKNESFHNGDVRLTTSGSFLFICVP